MVPTNLIGVDGFYSDSQWRAWSFAHHTRSSRAGGLIAERSAEPCDVARGRGHQALASDGVGSEETRSAGLPSAQPQKGCPQQGIPEFVFWWGLKGGLGQSLLAFVERCSRFGPTVQH